MKLTKETIQTTTLKGGIYLFTNSINNKHYIGQAVSLRKRLRAHLGNIIHHKYDNPLYRAVYKYGIEHFEISILEILDIEDKEVLRKRLDELEIFYIEKYDSYKSGYNQTKGADGGIFGYKMTNEQKRTISEGSKKVACDGRYFVYCKNIETGEIVSDANMTELAVKMDLNLGGIRTAKSKKRLYKGRYLFASSIEEIEELEKLFKKYKTFNKYDPTSSNEGLYIDYYKYLLTLDNPTIAQIADGLGLSKDAINKRNKKLREMGYTLPIRSKNKIDYIELIDTINNTVEKVQLQDISNKFNISIESARKQIKRTSLYKKQYRFNIGYV